MENISQLISNLGFPIACVIAMFYMWNKEREEHKTEIEQLRATISQVEISIVNNTNALSKLVDKLDKE